MNPNPRTRPSSPETTAFPDNKPADHATAFFSTQPPKNVAQVAQTLASHGGGAISVDLAFDLVLHDLVGQAREVSGATGAAIALLRDGEMVCRATSGENAPDLGVRVETGSGLAAACWSTGQVQLCRDTETDSRVNAEACRRLGVRSMLLAPLIDAGTTFGILQVFSAWPNSFGEREISALQELTRKIADNKREAEGGTGVFAGVESESTATAGAVSDSVHTVEDEKQSQAPEHTPLMGPEKLKGSETWTSILVLLVIAAAVLLGVVIGWSGASNRWFGSQPTPATSAISANAPVENASQQMPAPASSGLKESTSVPLPEPRASNTQNSTSPPNGGLVITENGRVIYRMPPTESGEIGGRNAASHSRTRLIHRVEPEYPALAREKKIQGAVVLDVQIAGNGMVENVNVVSGEPVLAEAAVKAVKQWRYRPDFADGHPVESQTRITIKFVLPF